MKDCKIVIPRCMLSDIEEEKFIEDYMCTIHYEFPSLKGGVNAETYENTGEKTEHVYCYNYNIELTRNPVISHITSRDVPKIRDEYIIKSFNDLSADESKVIIDEIVRESKQFRYIYEVYEQLTKDKWNNIIAAYVIRGYKYKKYLPERGN